MTTRTRNKSGQFRTKRWDTKIWTLEKEYGIDLGVRSDMKLSTYLWKNWFPSLEKLINNK
jgi:hypothetical protein